MQSNIVKLNKRWGRGDKTLVLFEEQASFPQGFNGERNQSSQNFSWLHQYLYISLESITKQTKQHLLCLLVNEVYSTHLGFM